MQGDKMKFITKHDAMIYLEVKKSIEGMQYMQYFSHHWLPRFYQIYLQHLSRAADVIYD